MRFGAWNVRTLLDRNDNACPEHKTAIVARELSRYNIDVAALSETHLADEGELVEQGGGYTFFWKGLASSEPRRSCVQKSLKSKLYNAAAAAPIWLVNLGAISHCGNYRKRTESKAAACASLRRSRGKPLIVSLEKLYGCTYTSILVRWISWLQHQLVVLPCHHSYVLLATTALRPEIAIESAYKMGVLK
ncbi:hypothetical protein MSG28_008851 [Choristoneura fumiferana]|uniref:Uncharacterized protein n=1 Tax=Choristoneura fumiferana TaxID=7141 RepID=A0ACC0J874_CHOFU|nr:hypothetical protein MSG28_008851 [Choristoneura fumiferana]